MLDVRCGDGSNENLKCIFSKSDNDWLVFRVSQLRSHSLSRDTLWFMEPPASDSIMSSVLSPSSMFRYLNLGGIQLKYESEVDKRDCLRRFHPMLPKVIALTLPPSNYKFPEPPYKLLSPSTNLRNLTLTFTTITWYETHIKDALEHVTTSLFHLSSL